MSDGVTPVPGWTALQAADMQKVFYKLNEQRRRQAAQKQAPRHVHLTLAPHKPGPERIVDTLRRNRHRNPNRFLA